MISLIFGSPGSGKTTYAGRIVSKELKRRKPRTIYTNFPMFGCLRIDLFQFGLFQPAAGSLIIWDESGIDFNNRNYKDFGSHRVQFLKLHRHYECDIMFISQSWEDVDITIRRLAVDLIYIRKIAGVTLCRRIDAYVFMDEERHQPADGYRWRPIWHLLMFLFLQRPLFAFLRFPYYHMFDSWLAPPMSKLPFILWNDKYKAPRFLIANSLLKGFIKRLNALCRVFKKILKKVHLKFKSFLGLFRAQR